MDSIKIYSMFLAGREITNNITQSISQTLSQSLEPMTRAINNMVATITERLPPAPQQQGFPPQFGYYGTGQDQASLKGVMPPPQTFYHATTSSNPAPEG